MSTAKGSLMSWQEVLNLTNNSKIRKIVKRKMKAGGSAAKLKSAIIEWQSLSNPALKKLAFKKIQHA